MGKLSNQNIIRLYYDYLSRNDEEIFEKIITPDITIFSTYKYQYIKGFTEFIHEFWNAFSEIRFEINEVLKTANKVIARWTMMAISKGKFRNTMPANKKISVSGIDIFEIRGKKIANIWSYNNIADYLVLQPPRIKEDYRKWTANEYFVEGTLAELNNTGYPLEYLTRSILKNAGFKVSHRFYSLFLPLY